MSLTHFIRGLVSLLCLACHIIADEANFQRIHVEDGTLYFDDGTEVALWGVNFQAALSYELGRFQKMGYFKQFDLDAWIKMTDRSFDEIELMGCDLIRIHLSPRDLADDKGNLVETPWLQMLDYTLAECRKRGIYVNLALLNHMGFYLDDSFIGTKHGKQSKWEWMTVPAKLKATENYIRQLVNRSNPYDNNIQYKENPAWVVAEFINEPMFPREKPSRTDSPEAVGVYEKWLNKHSKPDNRKSFGEYKYQSIKSYINRLVILLDSEDVDAVPCWNLFWVKGPIHEGWESYDAAADSEIELISFSTYPGQGEIQAVNRKPTDLSGKNFLPYLKKAYEERDWQGWLRDDRFKAKCGRIVYEFEGWANQSAYIYPAMAKYFRSQGAQMATMWTYSLNGLANHFGRTWNHNLNVRTTPRKAAGFMVAGEIFRNTPRYQSYVTSTPESDFGESHAFSFKEDFSVYYDNGQFLSSGTIAPEVVSTPGNPVRIVGYGNSPMVDYNGTGIYLLNRIESLENEVWELKILPNARFIDNSLNRQSPAVALEAETSSLMLLNLPGKAFETSVFEVINNSTRQIETLGDDTIVELRISPGNYLVKRKPLNSGSYR